MLMAAALLVLVLVLAGLAVWLARALASLRTDSLAQLQERNAEMERRLQGLTEAVDRRLADLDTKGDRRMEHAAQQTNAIHKQLGDVGRATAQLAEQAKDLGQLQQILRPPKARGGFGELLLGNLLADRLPADAFSLQHTFRGGGGGGAGVRAGKGGRG